MATESAGPVSVPSTPSPESRPPWADPDYQDLQVLFKWRFS